MTRLYPSILMLFVLIAALISCGSPTAGTAPTQPAAIATAVAATPMPATVVTAMPTPGILNKTVNVGEYGLHLVCNGAGNPTVVLDSGLGVDWTVWAGVMQQANTFTRICAYDRAGLGESGQARKPRTSKDMAKDLHTLLINANITGPYVLVGWSIAGFNLRVYASEYPADVVGMVLVDASHPDQNARWLAILPPPSPKDSADLRDFRNWLTTHDPSQNPEGMDIEASAAQVRATGSLGSIPLVVLTHGLSDASPGIPKDVDTKLEQVWLELQNELANLSSNSSHEISKLSHHCIPCDHPTIVVVAIKKVVTAVRKK